MLTVVASDEDGVDQQAAAAVHDYTITGSNCHEASTSGSSTSFVLLPSHSAVPAASNALDVHLTVLAESWVTVALAASATTDASVRYEVGLGEEGGQVTSVRECTAALGCVDKCRAGTPGVLSQNAAGGGAQLWIRLLGGVLEAGHGTLVGVGAPLVSCAVGSLPAGSLNRRACAYQIA